MEGEGDRPSRPSGTGGISRSSSAASGHTRPNVDSVRVLRREGLAGDTLGPPPPNAILSVIACMSGAAYPTPPGAMSPRTTTPVRWWASVVGGGAGVDDPSDGLPPALGRAPSVLSWRPLRFRGTGDQGEKIRPTLWRCGCPGGDHERRARRGWTAGGEDDDDERDCGRRGRSRTTTTATATGKPRSRANDRRCCWGRPRRGRRKSTCRTARAGRALG